MGPGRVRDEKREFLRSLALRALRFPFGAVVDFLVEDRCVLCRRAYRARRGAVESPPAAYLTAPLSVRCLWGAAGVVNHPVCARCAADLVVAESPGVLVAGPLPRDAPVRESSEDGASAGERRQGRGQGRPIVVVSPFMTTDGTLEIVHLMKFSGYAGLAEPVGRAVAWAVRRFAGTPDGFGLAVPTPLDSRSLRRRGFNQAERIAAALAADLDIAVAADLLRKVAVTKRQSLTSREMRAANVRGAFACPVGAGPRLSGRPVLLVDDLVTTGATAGACAEALFEAGATSVTVACFGRAL